MKHAMAQGIENHYFEIYCRSSEGSRKVKLEDYLQSKIVLSNQTKRLTFFKSNLFLNCFPAGFLSAIITLKFQFQFFLD